MGKPIVDRFGNDATHLDGRSLDLGWPHPRTNLPAATRFRTRGIEPLKGLLRRTFDTVIDPPGFTPDFTDTYEKADEVR